MSFDRNKSKGYFLLYSSVFDHPLVGPEKPFDRYAAWCWLLKEACRSKRGRDRIIDGKLLHEEYGQVITSYRFMASQWGWSVKKVRGHIDRLEAAAMLSRTTSHRLTHLTISNFETYQQRGHIEGHSEERAQAPGETPAEPGQNPTHPNDKETGGCESERHTEGTLRAHQGHSEERAQASGEVQTESGQNPAHSGKQIGHTEGHNEARAQASGKFQTKPGQNPTHPNDEETGSCESERHTEGTLRAHQGHNEGHTEARAQVFGKLQTKPGQNPTHPNDEETGSCESERHTEGTLRAHQGHTEGTNYNRLTGKQVNKKNKTNFLPEIEAVFADSFDTFCRNYPHGRINRKKSIEFWNRSVAPEGEGVLERLYFALGNYKGKCFRDPRFRKLSCHEFLEQWREWENGVPARKSVSAKNNGTPTETAQEPSSASIGASKETSTGTAGKDCDNRNEPGNGALSLPARPGKGIPAETAGEASSASIGGGNELPDAPAEPFDDGGDEPVDEVIPLSTVPAEPFDDGGDEPVDEVIPLSTVPAEPFNDDGDESVDEIIPLSSGTARSELPYPIDSVPHFVDGRLVRPPETPFQAGSRPVWPPLTGKAGSTDGAANGHRNGSPNRTGKDHPNGSPNGISKGHRNGSSNGTLNGRQNIPGNGRPADGQPPNRPAGSAGRKAAPGSPKPQKPSIPERINGKSIVLFFCAMHEYYLDGRKYFPDWKRDGRLVKDLHAQMGRKIFTLIDCYLNACENPKEYWTTRPRTVSGFRHFINEIQQHQEMFG